MIPGTDLLYMGQGQKEKKGATKGKRGAGVWELERAKYDKTQDRCDSPIYTALLVLFGSDGNVFVPPQSRRSSSHVLLCTMQFTQPFKTFIKQTRKKT